MIVLSGAQLAAAPDEGKNFTVSDSPEATVFNLKVPSNNRHINDFRGQPEAEPTPAPAPVMRSEDPCAPGMVTDYVDKYLVRLEKSCARCGGNRFAV